VTLDQVDIWFQDEARVGQQGTNTRIWAPKGTRPRVVRQKQFISAYIFGAVCPKLDLAIALVLPIANTDAMQKHVEEIIKYVPDGRHAVVVADKAGWHTSKELDWGDKISFLPLPPYSPELNPTERVWEKLREDDLANRCFENYDAILTACYDAWNNFAEVPKAVLNLCSRKGADLDS
jgi:transposase